MNNQYSSSHASSHRALVLVMILVGIVSLCGAAQLSWAQEEAVSPEAPPELRLSMREAMQAAVDENPTVQLFRERITQAEEQAATQFGALLPNIEARTSYARRRFFRGSFGGDPEATSPRNFYEARVSLTQNIFSLSLIEKWRAARMNVEVASLDSKTQKMDTMAIVGLAYLETLRAQKAVEARLADVRLNKQLLRLAMERKSVGMATSLDVTRAKVQLENEKQRLLVARNEDSRAQLNLSRGIGLPFDVKIILTDKLTLTKVVPQTIRDALQVASENRVELKVQKKRERLAELSLSSVTMERVPSLTGSGDIGRIGNRLNETVTTDNLQLMLSIPIFDGGQREGRISERRSVVLQESLRTRDIAYQVALEVRDALLTLESTQQQVAVAQESASFDIPGTPSRPTALRRWRRDQYRSHGRPNVRGAGPGQSD